MKPARLRNLPAWAVIGVFVATAGVLPAQTVTVGEGKEVITAAGQTVVVDGDDVRIEGGGHEVSVDWRGAGTRYGSADTENILVELGATRQGDLIRLALEGDILFDFDSTAIRADAAGQLAKAAHVIRQRSVGEVYVVGHTDSKGSDDYNRRLSRDRAVAVMGWLGGQEGIPASVMVGRGMGAAKPVAYNTMPDGSDNPEGRAKNRRVEILLATREGVDLVDVAGLVRIGPGGIDVGGGAVRVDEGGIDVGGGAVRVDEGGIDVGGAVRVDEGGVKVGGVEVTASGVRVGGVTVGTTGTGVGSQVVDEETPASCKPANICSFSCPDGNCVMTCEAGATCQMTCSGGNCNMRCNPGANCDLACSGGDCRFACPIGSVCQTSCTGDGCRRS